MTYFAINKKLHYCTRYFIVIYKCASIGASMSDSDSKITTGDKRYFPQLPKI